MGIENPVHLIFLAAVALIVLGPRRLPELARRLGQGVREFREAMDMGAEHMEAHPPDPATAVQPPAPLPAPAPTEAAPAEPAPAAAEVPEPGEGTGQEPPAAFAQSPAAAGEQVHKG